MITAAMLGLPAGMDVEALVLTVAALCVGLVVLFDLYAKSARPKLSLIHISEPTRPY